MVKYILFLFFDLRSNLYQKTHFFEEKSKLNVHDRKMHQKLISHNIYDFSSDKMILTD